MTNYSKLLFIISTSTVLNKHLLHVKQKIIFLIFIFQKFPRPDKPEKPVYYP